MDAITFSQLHRIAGYVEAGEGETVKYYQDDATKEWFVRVGNKTYHDASLATAFETALIDSNDYHKRSYDMEPAK